MLLSRAYLGASDRATVLDLWLAARGPGLDDPWPSLDALAAELDTQTAGSAQIRLWQDAHGTLHAAALLLDDCILVWRARPGADDDVLTGEILAWGQSATVQLARGAGVGLALVVPMRSNDLRVVALLAHAGFRRDEWRLLWMERSLQGPLAPPQVPANVVLRPVVGEADRAAALALHRSLFAVGEKTAGERTALMRAPGYRPGLDLVAVAADGSLLGYTLGVCCEVGRSAGSNTWAWHERSAGAGSGGR